MTKFARKVKKRNRSVYMSVRDTCNANADNDTQVFGQSYTNDASLVRKTVFTGSPQFTVKEIQIFEITDETSLHRRRRRIVVIDCPLRRFAALEPDARETALGSCSYLRSQLEGKDSRAWRRTDA
jgi:hypothetical protein